MIKSKYDYKKLIKNAFIFDNAPFFENENDTENHGRDELVVSFEGELTILNVYEYEMGDMIVTARIVVTKKEAFEWLVKNEKEFKIQNLEKLLRLLEYHGKFLQDPMILQIEEIIEKVKSMDKREGIYDNVVSDLIELAKTIENKCYRSSIALSGRLLEFILKTWMTRNGIKYDEDWMVGTILKKIGEKKLQIGIAINNIWNIINMYRISNVHCKNNEIPSENEAKMVVHGVLTIFNKAFIL